MNLLSATDRSFLKRFAIVVAGLHVIAALLIVLALVLYARHPPATAPHGNADVLHSRIAPIGDVYSGETGRAAALAAQKQVAATAASAQAYGGTTDGKTIFDNLCHTCHAAGIAGAPKVGDKAAWGPRISQGADSLNAHAINGYQGKSGVMPAKGGNPALTEEQVKAAVSWMIAQAT